jgi:hypothetical protein
VGRKDGPELTYDVNGKLSRRKRGRNCGYVRKPAAAVTFAFACWVRKRYLRSCSVVDRALLVCSFHECYFAISPYMLITTEYSYGNAPVLSFNPRLARHCQYRCEYVVNIRQSREEMRRKVALTRGCHSVRLPTSKYNSNAADVMINLLGTTKKFRAHSKFSRYYGGCALYAYALDERSVRRLRSWRQMLKEHHE